MNLIFILLPLAILSFLLGYFISFSKQKGKQADIERQLLDVKGALDETAIVAITDSKGRILEVNDKFCELSGYSRAELLGQDHRLLNSGHHEKEFFKNMWATIGKGESWQAEVKNKAKDGSYYWVDTKVVPFLNENGKPHKYIAIRFDITDRKNGEEELRLSLESNVELTKNLEDIYNALDEAAIVVITNEKGIIEKVNDKFCELSKYSPRELIGQDHRILNSGHHEKSFFKNMWSTIGRGFVWRGAVKNRAKDGTFYWVDTHIIPLLNAKGKPFKYVAIRFDITAKVEMEQDLLQAIGDIEKYTKVFSHDLKTPLRGISTLTEFIKDDIEETASEEVIKNLDLIKSRTLSISNLADGLLQFSDVNQLENATTFNAGDVLTGLVKQFGTPINIEGDWPVLRTKKHKFTQVFGRLIDNAVKFNLSDDKQVTISVEEKVFDYIFSVRDNGPGINKEYQEKVFELFQILNDWKENASRGVGLTIAKKLVSQLGGEIWVESDGKSGSTFFFRIPKRR